MAKTQKIHITRKEALRLFKQDTGESEYAFNKEFPRGTTFYFDKNGMHMKVKP